MTTTTYKPISMMKKELRRIVRDIDKKLYSKLREPLAITWQVYEEFDTAESYFIEQLMNDELCPWTLAECLRNLGHPSIADNLEMFASTFDFSTKVMDSIDIMEIEVKNATPMEMEVKNATSMEMEVKNATPMEMEVKNATPMEMEVKNATPMEMEVKNATPLEMEVKNAIPMEMEVKNAIPMKMEVKNATPMEMEIEVKNAEPKRVIIETYERRQMKKELSQIARNIEPGLYKQLIDTFLIPDNVVKEFKTAELYFVDQLLNEELKPWEYANAFRTLNYIDLEEIFEEFAKKYNFTKTDSTITKTIQPIIEKDPEKSILELLKLLKSELTQNELLGLRESSSKTFESIFSDLLNLNLLTPSLEELKQKLSEEIRGDLVYSVAIASQIVSKLDSVTFQRIVTLCLDTLDVDIFSLLSALRDALSKEFSSFHTLSIGTKQFSYSTDFIPLTFTEEVDIRTLPLTEGSDAELITLMENANKQENKETRYIDAHTEIYSIVNHGKIISLIGHPGTGKTFYCNKLINEFTNSVNNAFRFVLLLSCRNSQWHTIEEKYRKYPHQTSLMLHYLLFVAVPTFHNSEDLVSIILKTKGSGLLLVIDSFDEFYSYDHLDSTLLYKILKRQVLTKATILITSRPGAWNKLLSEYRDYFQFQHSWQLIGFAPEQRDQYILHMLSPVKAELCHKFLVNKPELILLSLVPVNISLITGLVDSTDLLKHINTLTDAYTSLVLFTLNKELKRIYPHSVSISTLQGMPADMRTIFNKLAEMCYNGLIARKITFSPKEFSIIKTSSKKYVKGLGLFQLIRVITAHFSVEEYLSCPHLTLQEFLSAYHLAQKSPAEIKSFVQQTFSNGTWPAMKVCVRFLCGILTQGHNTIINIITDNLHRTSFPLLDCKYELFEYKYALSYAYLHYDNTATHLSVLPYVLETNQPSIISSYYKLLCPANSNMPYFYLRRKITPVDTYSLTQYFSLLPPSSTISVLSIDLTLLNNIQIDMLASSINIISIDTLLVAFRSTKNTSLIKHYKEDIKYELQQHIQWKLWKDSLGLAELYHFTSNIDNKFFQPNKIVEYFVKYLLKKYIEEIKYEIQQLHIQDLHTHDIPTLLTKLESIIYYKYKYIYNNYITKMYDIIYELQYLISTLKLPITVSNSATQADNIHIQKLFSFIRNIDNASCLHTPKHIYYQFNNVSFMDDKIMNTLIDTISSNATYVMLDNCYFTTQFITSLVTSLSKLKYLYIDDFTLKNLRSRLNYQTINALTFQILKERNLKGLYLTNVTLQESLLYEYLQSQSTLQEIHLRDTTDSILDTLHAIQHLTSLKYLYIINSYTLEENEEYMSAYLANLHNNRHTLSYFNFNITTKRYTDILPTLSQCHNLQYIDLFSCGLKPHHMPALATTINKLHALLCINMYYSSNITDEGIITLTDTLATRNTVIWINLSSCDLSSAPVIISLVNKFPSLLKIDLSYNELAIYNKFNDTSKEELKTFTKLRKIYLTI